MATLIQKELVASNKSYVDFMIVYEATWKRRHVFMRSPLPRDEANCVSFRLCLAYYGPCGRFGTKNSLKNLAFRTPYTPLLLPTHIVSHSFGDGTTKFNLDGPEIATVVERPQTLVQTWFGISTLFPTFVLLSSCFLFQQVGMCSSTYTPIGKLGDGSTGVQWCSKCSLPMGVHLCDHIGRIGHWTTSLSEIRFNSHLES